MFPFGFPLKQAQHRYQGFPPFPFVDPPTVVSTDTISKRQLLIRGNPVTRVKHMISHEGPNLEQAMATPKFVKLFGPKKAKPLVPRSGQGQGNPTDLLGEGATRAREPGWAKKKKRNHLTANRSSGHFFVEKKGEPKKMIERTPCLNHD